MLFNEPKLLKCVLSEPFRMERSSFSALQRAEIAEMERESRPTPHNSGFSALQRAEIAEIAPTAFFAPQQLAVSVLFNEPKLLKCRGAPTHTRRSAVSVLFNEPKLLKLFPYVGGKYSVARFSALQRAEIAEMSTAPNSRAPSGAFQCSSTSRNC